MTKRGFHVLSTAVSTLALALALLVLEHAHLFDWMDSVALDVVGAQTHQKDELSAPSSKISPVWTVRVDELAYAELFNETSPLNQKKLAEVVQKILLSKPAVLAIDIDISPAYQKSSSVNEGVELRDIDRLLIDAVKVSALPVILVQGSPSEPREPMVMRWMAEMCKQGIRFASPYLLSHFGTVTKFRDSKETFSRMAFDEYTRKGSSTNETCQLLRKTLNAKTYFNALEAKHTERGNKAYPLNLKTLGSVSSASKVMTDVTNSIYVVPELPVGKIVLLGGSYPSQDKHRTPRGEHPGMMIHAAAMSSLLEPIKPWKTYQVFMIELVLGTLLGLFFHKVWVAQDRLSKRLKVHWDSRRSIETLRKKAKAIKWLFLVLAKRFLALASLLLVLLLPFLLTYAALLILGVVMQYETWFNPGPLIFGLFLHSILVRVESLHANHHHELSLRRFLLHHVDVLIVVVAASAVLMVQGLLGGH